MGFLETVFGIQIGKKHNDNYYEWFKLLFSDIKVTYKGNSQIITAQNYDKKLIKKYIKKTEKGKCIIELNTYDDVIIELKELNGEESVYDFFNSNIELLCPNGHKFYAGKHVCVDAIGWSIGDSGDIKVIQPNELEQLVKLREKLISEHRLSENSNITYTSNCCS